MRKEPTKLYPDGAEVAFRTMLEAIAKTGHAVGDTPEFSITELEERVLPGYRVP